VTQYRKCYATGQKTCQGVDYASDYCVSARQNSLFERLQQHDTAFSASWL